MIDGPILVSVIVPMRNEARFVETCLRTLLSNHVPGVFEILVMDGASTDGSRALVETIAASDRRVVLLDNPSTSIPAALNIGIRNARGRYIVRADAHAVYPPDYLHNSISELEATGADNVGGSWLVVPAEDSPVSLAITRSRSHIFGVGNADYRLGRSGKDVDTVPFGAFRRELFERIGLFREDLPRHEDYEFNARIRKTGGRVYLSPLIEITYYSVSTLGDFARRMFADGLSVGRAWMRYPYSFAFRHAAPVTLLSALMALAVAGTWASEARIAALGLLCLYAIVAGTMAVRASAGEGLRAIARQLFVFVLSHFTFGLGTAAGLLTTRPRS